ncbi:hypothetical protein MSAN_01050200 [Mycena sanguinolenta]|uniref:Extradiol ring-cleavage dioxygenase class III enzyme subunit B domain-containing protein n=1 Tax=Mycena sanguinolenta TaxID=230812 RepID=A0A8H6YT99_9AGAR|nr:hypothetical protein MSAN_01050200 [Mycena sanguinolenta]
MRILLFTTALFILSLVSAFYLAQSNFNILPLLSRILPSRYKSYNYSPSVTANMTDAAINLKVLQEKWRKNLEELPSTPANIPAFFFAHGSPMLAFAPRQRGETPSAGS